MSSLEASVTMQSVETSADHSMDMKAPGIRDTRPPKPKTRPCSLCSKRFRRIEHVQRHERTHTKEKPYSCDWEQCGKSFGRRDLLLRHTKLVHLNKGPHKKASRPGKSPTSNSDTTSSKVANSQIISPMVPEAQISPGRYLAETISPLAVPMLSQNPRNSSREAVRNLDILPDIASKVASANEVNSMPPTLSETTQKNHRTSHMKSLEEDISHAEQERDHQSNTAGMPIRFSVQAPTHAFDDYNLFLDESTSSSHSLPQLFDGDLNTGSWPRGMADFQRTGLSKPSSQFPSRFPSVQPEGKDVTDLGTRGSEESPRASSLKVSLADHLAIKNKLDEFSSVLPKDFVFPSRHTLTRFLEGYASIFDEGLPILHLPTVVPPELAPELVLAISAVGARCRFENYRGNSLWYAAREVALEQIRRRHSHEIHALLPTTAASSPYSNGQSPCSGLRHSFTSVHPERPIRQDTHCELYSPNTPQARLETMQALLLLLAVGLWGGKAIMQEALALQSRLALLVREESSATGPSQLADWETWIRAEGANRTKLITYCFFNLCSIAHNNPPLLLTSETSVFLPGSEKVWRAETVWQWQEVRQAVPRPDMTLQDAFSRLFSPSSSQDQVPHISNLGNYGLIHALLQHIFLLKQTSLPSAPTFEASRGLRSDDMEEVRQALQTWRTRFELHQASFAENNQLGTNEPTLDGQIAYNTAALFRLASIRLYTDLSPGRNLETRDAEQIATSLFEAPHLVRSARLNQAVLQAIHALSLLVKQGVNYVARTKSAEWSIQHSFCNLECAALLSKWLMTLASTDVELLDPTTLSEDRLLLESLRRMLDETEFAVPVDPALASANSDPTPNTEFATNNGDNLRRLAIAVIRLWAETFKGPHIFDIVEAFGHGLEIYAIHLEKSISPRRAGPDTRS